MIAPSVVVETEKYIPVDDHLARTAPGREARFSGRLKS